jgi:hypothetical protein
MDNKLTTILMVDDDRAIRTLVRSSIEQDERAKDFTPIQQAILQHVREIWAEHCP